jgi:hypothetical protein
MTKTPKGKLSATLMAAANLHPSLHLDAVPSQAAFGAAMAAAPGGSPCAGKPAGTPCMVYPGPDGQMIVCTCDGAGNCLFPN